MDLEVERAISSHEIVLISLLSQHSTRSVANVEFENEEVGFLTFLGRESSGKGGVGTEVRC